MYWNDNFFQSHWLLSIINFVGNEFDDRESEELFFKNGADFATFFNS